MLRTASIVRSRRAVALTATGLAACLLILSCRPVDAPSEPGADSPVIAHPAFGAPPSAEQRARNWPMFRGASGQGRAEALNLPAFDGSLGVGVRWKTPVPLPGKNSPVVWQDRIFVTGADRHSRKIFAFHADDGRPLWSVAVATPRTPPPPTVMEEYTGYAAPTAATDGRAVYAIFANGDVAAVDMDGNSLWMRSLGLPENVYGHASSLLVHDDIVIVQFDQGYEEEGLSRILALSCLTGETLWSVARPVAASWATPILLTDDDGVRLVAAAMPYVIAYDPRDGRELWRARTVEGDVAATPVFVGGLVFAVSPDLALFAIRADGRGDVSATHVVWKSDVGAPDVTSPVGDEERLLTVATYGLLTCHEVATGRMLWERYIDDEEFYGSPIVAGGRFYLFSREGRAYAVDSADEPRIAVVGALGEDTYTSPAVVDGRLYIRGVEHLYAIDPQKPDPESN